MLTEQKNSPDGCRRIAKCSDDGIYGRGHFQRIQCQLLGVSDSHVEKDKLKFSTMNNCLRCCGTGTKTNCKLIIGDGYQLGTLWSSAFWIARAIAIIPSAYFERHSAVRRKHAALNVGAYWWVLFTLVGGFWMLYIYWVMEHSTLSVRREADDHWR